MDLSIVIVSYNTREMLRACLNSLTDGTRGLDVETFVVDNASPDGSAEMVRAEFAGVRLFANADNAGFTRANNQALRLSTGRHVVILNPDTEAEPGSLTVLVRYLDSHPEVGAVGPKLLNSDGSLQHNGRRFPTPWRDFLAITGLWKLRARAFERGMEFGREDFDREAEIDFVMGACLMVRREVMEQVGMLDEDFYMFYEEVEWCWRIRRAGWKVMYVPQSRIVHHHMGSVRQRVWAMSNRLLKSAVTYYGKTGTPMQRLGVLPVVAVGYAKNALIQFGVRVKRFLRGLKRLR
jgi:N-acetylglucosaminyl-diphospho-decaprenol L-rhamnosyltransferase